LPRTGFIPYAESRCDEKLADARKADDGNPVWVVEEA